MALKYIGNGDFLPGIPARDLTDAEAKLYGGEMVLTKTGLYERVEAKPVKGEKEIKG